MPTKIVPIPVGMRDIEHFEFDMGNAPAGTVDLPVSKTSIPVEKFAHTLTFNNEFVAESIFDDKRLLESLVMKEYKEFMSGLEANCKTLYVAPRRITVEHDKLRYQTHVTWSNQVASPEMDYFKTLFACKREHYDPVKHNCYKEHFDPLIHQMYRPPTPTTVRGALRLTWRLFRAKLLRRSKRKKETI